MPVDENYCGSSFEGIPHPLFGCLNGCSVEKRGLRQLKQPAGQTIVQLAVQIDRRTDSEAFFSGVAALCLTRFLDANLCFCVFVLTQSGFVNRWAIDKVASRYSSAISFVRGGIAFGWVFFGYT